MSEILLRAEDAKDAAKRVTKSAETANQEFEGLKAFLGGLESSFRGQTAAAFHESFDQWKQSAVQLNEALTSLGNFLNDAAVAIEQVDSDLASRLRGS